MELSTAIAALVEQQRGVATRRQLLDGGVTPAQIRWAVGRRWRLLLPRVILLDPSLPTDEQRLVAALLFAGDDSWLAGSTAGAVHALPGCSLTAPIQVRVPPHRTSRTVSWVHVTRSYVTDERLVERGPLRVSCRPRALVDAAADCPADEQARAMLIDAVQQRLVRLDDVAHWVEARQSDGRRRLRRALEDAAAGAWSLPEAQLLELMRRSTVLPRPWANPGLVDLEGCRLTTPDMWFDDVALAVMVHSREFHAGVLDWEATVAADEDLENAGAVVTSVTPQAVTRDPHGTLGRVEAAYQRALRWPRERRIVAQSRPALPLGAISAWSQRVS
ncbi:MAG: hypothetical protein ABJA89_01680 [Lapillicoccus sp.]